MSSTSETMVSSRGAADAGTAVADSIEDQLLRAVSWRSSAGEWVIQNDCIRYANPQLARLAGRDLSAILNQSPDRFLHPDDRADFAAELLRRLVAEGESDPIGVRLVQPDGTVVVVEVTASRLEWEGQPALMSTIIDVTRRSQADVQLKEQVRFERLLADISATFVNLPADQIDDQIATSLQSLIDFLGNDRSSFVEFCDDDRHVLVKHSCTREGCEGFPLGEFPIERLPWFIGQFRSGKVVFVRDTDTELPPEALLERQYCRKHGVRSNVTVPLAAGGEVLGGLTFAFLRAYCEWPENVISRLKLVGEVFANALLRRRTETRLRVALLENEQLRCQLEEENLYLREQTLLKHQHGRIIGRSDAMTRVLANAERVAVTDAPVLLLGETGTGKELLAQTIHELSGRKSRPMVVVNCASLPATLIESELFGRAAGAYTGAGSAQVGRFELASGSSLFLDEIGELPLELQAKLLRVLQDGRFERLGSSKTIAVDVRVIAATNLDLEQAMADGTFRIDLYHRLNVFPIYIPPLRERREDIPPLVWTFVESFGRRMGKTIKCIPRKCLQQLQNYDWPGNVRELSNVVERAMILASGETLVVELPGAARKPAIFSMTLHASEEEHIRRVLQQTGWRVRGPGGAADRLDIKPTTLEARMAKLGIRRPSKHSEGQ